jgi:Holliday junction DNA helicase RuvA
VLVEVAGVGYRVTVLPGTFAELGLGTEALLFTHLHVREDALVLYGFASCDERTCFESLLGAHGVGPGLAMAILSVHGPEALRRVLLDDDVDALTLVPGIGKKTAARLLVELKARLSVPDLDGAVPGTNGSSARAEVRAALSGLGYEPEEVRGVLADLPAEGDLEPMLREALRLLGASR